MGCSSSRFCFTRRQKHADLPVQDPAWTYAWSCEWTPREKYIAYAWWLLKRDPGFELPRGRATSISVPLIPYGNERAALEVAILRCPRLSTLFTYLDNSPLLRREGPQNRVLRLVVHDRHTAREFADVWLLLAVCAQAEGFHVSRLVFVCERLVQVGASQRGAPYNTSARTRLEVLEERSFQ